MGEIIYITGTDTGVGKTIVSCSIASKMKEAGIRVLACKPVCTGSFLDVKLLHASLEFEGPAEALNAYYFESPVSPYQAAEDIGATVNFGEILNWIRRRAEDPEILIVEGAGGLLTPLGSCFTNLELIQSLNCSCAVVCLNRLGVLNQVSAALRILNAEKIPTQIVMNEAGSRDESSSRNLAILRRFQPDLKEVLEFPFMGKGIDSWAAFKKNFKKLKKTIAWEKFGDTLSPSLRERLQQ